MLKKITNLDKIDIIERLTTQYNFTNDDANRIKEALNESLIELAQKITGQDISSLDEVSLSLASLTTTDKTNLINAINEVNSKSLPSVVNHLNETSTGKPLDANQGRVLKGLIDAINNKLASNDLDLDTIQEIVDFIKILETDLSNKANTSHTHSIADITDFTPTPIVDNLTSTSTTSALSANQGKVLKDKQDEGILVENLTGTQSKRVLLGKKIKFSGATVQANGDDAEVVIFSKTPLRVYLQVGANNSIAEEGNPNKPFADLYYWYRYFYNSSITYMEVVLLGVNQTFTFNGSFVNTWIDSAGTIQLGDAFIPTKFISLGANTIVFDCTSSVNKQVFFTYNAAASQDRPVYFDMPTSSISLTNSTLGQPSYGRNPIYIDCRNFNINTYTTTDSGARGITVYVNRLRCNQVNTVRSVNANFTSLYAFEILDVNNVNNTDVTQIYAIASGSEYRPTYTGVGFLFPKGTSRQTIIKNISTTTSTRLGAESGYTIFYNFENTVNTNSKIQLHSGSNAQGEITYSGNIVSSTNGIDLVRNAGSTSGVYTLRDLTLNSGVIGAFTWDFKSNGTLRIINSTIYATQKLFTFLTNVNIEIINSTILVGSANYVMSGTDSATNNIKIINSVTDGVGWIEAPSTLMVKQILGSTPTT